MIIFIILIVAAIALIVYVVKMHKVREKYLGKDAVEKIAEDAAQEARKNETVITCDYCGSKIDTTIQKTCPQCGASYGQDKEWIERNDVDKDRMDELIDSKIRHNRKKVRDLNAYSSIKVKRILILFGAIIVFIAAIVIIVSVSENVKRNSSVAISDDYVFSGYSFENANVIDNDSLKMELGDVFICPNYNDENDFNIEVKITNKSGKDINVNFEAVSVNNQGVWEWFNEDIGKSEEEIIRYIHFSHYEMESNFIKSIVLADMYIRDDSYDQILHDEKTMSFETNSSESVADVKAEGKELYKKDGISITLKEDHGEECIQVTNETDKSYKIRAELLADDETEMLTSGSYVPSGCQFERAFYDDGDTKELLAKVEFDCPEDKKAGFFTEWFRVK